MEEDKSAKKKIAENCNALFTGDIGTGLFNIIAYNGNYTIDYIFCLFQLDNYLLTACRCTAYVYLLESINMG